MPRLPKIHKINELYDLVEEIGFLPFFSGELPGFSLMDITEAKVWWSGNSGRDPWQWRQRVSAEGRMAYGKLFGKKAGFISKQWYPAFANFRRDGYDFDSLYDEGKVSHKCKTIMDLFESDEVLATHEIKRLANFGKDGQKGFEGAITQLQMQTYLTVCGFKRKENKFGEEYGWPVAVYSRPEDLFGYDFVRSEYDIDPKESKAKIFDRCMEYNLNAFDEDVERFLKL